MKQEDKNLLLKDICSRLPYGVKCRVVKRSIDGEMLFIRNELTLTFDNVKELVTNNMYEIKPYLFPLSSMTEEQHKEFYDKYCWNDGGDNFEIDSCSHSYALEKFDWLDKNHFDYRGLIPMGLAIDATNLGILLV